MGGRKASEEPAARVRERLDMGDVRAEVGCQSQCFENVPRVALDVSPRPGARRQTRMEDVRGTGQARCPDVARISVMIFCQASGG